MMKLFRDLHKKDKKNKKQLIYYHSLHFTDFHRKLKTNSPNKTMKFQFKTTIIRTEANLERLYMNNEYYTIPIYLYMRVRHTTKLIVEAISSYSVFYE